MNERTYKGLSSTLGASPWSPGIRLNEKLFLSPGELHALHVGDRVLVGSCPSALRSHIDMTLVKRTSLFSATHVLKRWIMMTTATIIMDHDNISPNKPTLLSFTNKTAR